MSRRLPRLFLVTDSQVVGAPDFLERARSALDAGGSRCALQLRAHGMKGRPLWAIAYSVAECARQANAGLWINDRIDLALAVRADGVQLGAASLPTPEARSLVGAAAWIGRSVHDGEEARAALDAGADVAMLGHIYQTATHPAAEPLGVAALRAAGSPRPIVAIGGITPERVADVMEAGAWGVAVLSGVWDAGDPGVAVRRYVEALASVIGEQ